MTSALFSPITMRGLTLPNRIVVSPMCQYNSDNGSANDWHLMHLGSFSLGAAGLVMTEMTNVNPAGRITHKCAGLWSDANEKALKRVHDFCRTYGVAKLGVQLAHAGRKGSTQTPAAGGKPLTAAENGWETGSAVGACRTTRAGRCRTRMTKDDIKPSDRRVRGRRQARRSHRLRRDRVARRPRLSAAPVPVAAVQPAHRRIWRQHRKPHALSARGVSGGARGLSRRQADRHARVGDRLGRRRLDAGGDRRARARTQEARLRLHGRLDRRPRSAPEDSAVARLPGAVRREGAQGNRHQDHVGRPDHRRATGRRDHRLRARPTSSSSAAASCTIRAGLGMRRKSSAPRPPMRRR